MAIMKQNTTSLVFLICNRTIKIAVITYYGKLSNNGCVPETGSWITSLFQTFPADSCGVSGIILQQQDRLVLFPRAHGTRRSIANKY